MRTPLEMLTSLWQRRSRNAMKEIANGRRDSCRLVGSAELIDGNRHIPVSLALSNSTLFYESPDLTSTVELQWVQDVEYDPAPPGTVMRLRCFDKVFEFVLDNRSVPQWRAALPPVHSA